MYARTKHVEMDNQFVFEKVVSGQLLTHFVKSTDQLGDIRTKALTKQVFSGFHNKLGVTTPPITYLRGIVGEGSMMKHVKGTGQLEMIDKLESY